MSILTRSPDKGDKKDKGNKPDEPASEKSETPPRSPQRGRRRAAVATTAAVNLLSPWVLDELRVRALRRRFVLGAVALLVVVAGTWGYLRLDLMRDQQDLRDDEAIGDGLQQQIGELADVKQYVANINVRVNSVEDTMTAQLAYAQVMEELDAALPQGAAFGTIEITPTAVRNDQDPAVAEATEVATCPGADPFGARPVVACVALMGTACSREDVSRLVESLSRSKLFVEPFVSVTTASRDESDSDSCGIDFEGTLGLDDATYTGRFADIDGSDAEEPDADAAADEGQTETARKAGR
jgi:Tfp pilus assembly protein PilN